MREPDLPHQFPIFPLPNVVLFPGAFLPLHMFEPRYRAMAEDALAGERMIGMVLIRPGGDPAEERATVFEVGCLGSIVDSRQLPDGRFNAVLHGIRRFRITDDETVSGGYRCATAEWLHEADFEDLSATVQHELSERAVVLERRLLELVQLTAPDAVEQTTQAISELDPIGMANAISFGLDIEPVEKQGLLEAGDPIVRVDTLLGLLEFKAAEIRMPGGTGTLN